MKTIIGLGNPGIEYAETRHNVGFLALDGLVEALNLGFRVKYQGLLAEGQIAGERVLLLKPQTFMNLSGRSVRDLANFYKISGEDLLVVHDDLDLPLGKIRLRNQGSAGGHNGIRSIIVELGTEKFWRLKIGVNRPPEQWDAARYVLSPFFPKEIPDLEEVLNRVEKAITLWVGGNHNKAMNLYNK
ncbi:MAG: aminoacyl-tRNA hydrolase [Desulfitobacteriaceae bacterium]